MHRGQLLILGLKIAGVANDYTGEMYKDMTSKDEDGN